MEEIEVSMTVFSQQVVRVKPDLRERAIKAALDRNVFEECASVIPGFVNAYLLEDVNDPSSLNLLTEWVDFQAQKNWMEHPLRAEQEAELSGYLIERPKFTMFTRRF